MPRWYVLETHAKAERWAAQCLGRAEYVTALPLVTERRRDRVIRSMTHKVRVPCFPGYLLIQLRIGRDSIHSVQHSEGVRRMFCSSDNQPIPLRPGVVEALMASAELDGRQFADLRHPAGGSLPAFTADTLLRITDGPFTDHEGVCLFSSSDRVRLLMTVMGSPHVVTVPRAAVVQAS